MDSMAGSLEQYSSVVRNLKSFIKSVSKNLEQVLSIEVVQVWNQMMNS